MAATRQPATRHPVTWKPAFALIGAALLACLVAAAATRQAVQAPVGLSDPGALVRWGLPVTRVAHDLAAALMIGMLVLAATVVPDDKSLPRVRVALRFASVAGGAWVAAGLIGVVLGFASIAGTPVTSPEFGAQLQTFVWSLEPLRAQIVSTALVLVATSIAAIATTRPGTALAAAVALVALLPLALAGHASGSADHETSVNALAVHLLAATVWVGGLAGIAILRPRLHPHLPVVVRRYSTIALVCFVALGVSGVLSAWLRIGSWAGLATSYGAVLLVKVGAFVLLGAAGWTQRRRVVEALGRTP
ncbi:MAG TPA: CopD family protein, partial [Candidatus Lustribacter sp.]|nr:CopD family protein [Candidatus Lustribacter sp.]